MAGLLIAGLPVRSADADDHERAYRLRESGDIVPLEQILESALNLHPGRVIEVELEGKGERRIYEIEIVDRQGVVWELEFDAGSGRLLERERQH
ncbi:MAG: PepSY domain-containing protein [Gammaproteobacteria bacterium]|nr:PepSY domain-containing protein [Gammaproteobacteria bacterium]